MAFLISYATGNNNRTTANMSPSSAGKWAADRARVANDYQPDNHASFDTGGGSVSSAYAAWYDKNYASTVKYINGSWGAAGFTKRFAHGNMWKLRKYLKKLGSGTTSNTGQNRDTYNASTTVVWSHK